MGMAVEIVIEHAEQRSDVDARNTVIAAREVSEQIA